MSHAAGSIPGIVDFPDGTPTVAGVPIGGGGLSHSTVGKTAIGGTADGPYNLMFLRQIVLTEDSALLAVNAYVAPTASSAATSITGVVMSDNAGAPGQLVVERETLTQASLGGGGGGSLLDLGPRWIRAPIGVWLPAGTYWIGCTTPDQELNIYHDAGAAYYYSVGGTHPNAGDADKLSGLSTLAWDISVYADILSGGGGGGGVSQAYVGYNTVGGSSTAMVDSTWYAKKITLAAPALLTDIEAYLTFGGTFNAPMWAALWTDNAGDPFLYLGGSPLGGNVGSFAAGTTGRWVGWSIGRWLTAGDYWIGVNMVTHQDSAAVIFYDGSGSDHTLTGNSNNGPGDIPLFGGTDVTTTNKYSIRASLVS